jgi:hypothetical protein
MLNKEDEELFVEKVKAGGKDRRLAFQAWEDTFSKELKEGNEAGCDELCTYLVGLIRDVEGGEPAIELEAIYRRRRRHQLAWRELEIGSDDAFVKKSRG